MDDLDLIKRIGLPDTTPETRERIEKAYGHMQKLEKGRFYLRRLNPDQPQRRYGRRNF